MKREINIKVTYSLDGLIKDKMKITDQNKVKEMIQKDMEKYFGWDEGYSGVSKSLY